MISGKNAENVYLTNGGLEWEITMPVSDMQSLSLNSDVKVFTWLYHREDQMRLYGFADEERRNTFLELLKVEGIGPKGAIKILGGIGQEELTRALEEGDLTRLEAVPGLGKKTAQKMLLALKGKLVQTQDNKTYGDLVEALTSMGYDRRGAIDALSRADTAIPASITGMEREKQLFKDAIVYLTGA